MSETSSERKAAVHRRVLDLYGALAGPDERRAFVHEMARAVGRSRESVYRWCGARAEKAAPPSTVLDRVEAYLRMKEGR